MDPETVEQLDAVNLANKLRHRQKLLQKTSCGWRSRAFLTAAPMTAVVAMMIIQDQMGTGSDWGGLIVVVMVISFTVDYTNRRIDALVESLRLDQRERDS